MAEQIAPWRVNRPTPFFQGESLDGYVARIAASHYFPRLAEITQVAGAQVSARQHASFCDLKQLDVLADCLRVDPAVLRHHAPLWSEDAETLNFFGTTVPKDFLQFTYRRFSPTALAQSPHHRGLWQLRILPVCIETWTYLEDRCPNPVCGRRQAWRRTTGIDLCDYCAEPLTRAEAKPVPQELRANLQCLVSLIHPDLERRAATRMVLAPQLAQLGGGELLELACALAPLIDPRVAKPLRSRKLAMDVAANVIVPAIAETWPFLSDWPRGLERFLIDRLNQNPRGMAAAKRDIVYQLLYKMRRRTLSRPVANVINEFADRCRAARADGVTIAEAVKLTGARQPALYAMRRAGELPTILALDGCRFQPLIPKDAIKDLADRKKPRMRLTHSAERLGIPTYTIHQLVDDGLLEAAPIPPGCRAQISVYQASVEDLSARLQARLDGNDEGFEVNLADLMKRIGGQPKPWSRIFSAILSGDLSARLATGKLPLAKRIMVKDDSVLSLPIFTDQDDMDWGGINVLKADVADMMNITPHNFSHYSDFLIGPGDRLRDIPMVTALRLARTYVGSGELGLCHDVHSAAVRHFLESQGVPAEYRGLYDRATAERLFSGSSEPCSKSWSAAVSPAARTSADRRDPLDLQSLVSPRGRLSLPVYLRRRMGLDLGGQVAFTETPEGILMRPVRPLDGKKRTGRLTFTKRTNPLTQGQEA
ncbi:AbrB/MazE/SpoVT family DNA-binding domain-containing protein [Novosphingobium sp. SG707]|uniref:AbrB/MazE/SpoVT family DNA-binding domain-containing protein n=1 Tax=Novosphingobium sp. SG707 TaxID=2586996 RepID=UPI001445DD0B|nr:AbrB/MazE/SpoVT family DNA-binding domain-containing protein [Novosphingobium sp. SG707]NKI99964.1 hypothetical protein [Novosphingobium sp. SG707]